MGCRYAFEMVGDNGRVKSFPVTGQEGPVVLYLRSAQDDNIPGLKRLNDEPIEAVDFSRGCGVMDARITDRGLQYLSEPSLLPNVNWLGLGYCRNITDEGLRHIATMEKLKALLLQGCKRITDKGLVHLAGMKNLEGLDLRGCPEITDEGLIVLSELKNLRSLMLGGCKQITPEGVQKIQTLMPNCNVRKDDDRWKAHYDCDQYKES